MVRNGTVRYGTERNGTKNSRSRAKNETFNVIREIYGENIFSGEKLFGLTKVRINAVSNYRGFPVLKILSNFTFRLINFNN